MSEYSMQFGYGPRMTSNRAIDSDTGQAPLALARARHCGRWCRTRHAGNGDRLDEKGVKAVNCNEISFVSVALMAVAKLALANSHQRYVVKSTNDLPVRRVDACSPGERASTKYAARLVEPTLTSTDTAMTAEIHNGYRIAVPLRSNVRQHDSSRSSPCFSERALLRRGS